MVVRGWGVWGVVVGRLYSTEFILGGGGGQTYDIKILCTRKIQFVVALFCAILSFFLVVCVVCIM